MPSEWHPAWLVLQNARLLADAHLQACWRLAPRCSQSGPLFVPRIARSRPQTGRSGRPSGRLISRSALDRRRTADETYAFLVAVGSATGTVVANVCAARPMVPQSASQAATPVAYQARQRVISPIFTDLRPACVRLGGDLTPLFVRLGQAICAFAADWVLGIPGAYQLADRCGATIGFHDGLNAIEGDAVSLGQEAHQRLTLCEDEIRSFGSLARRSRRSPPQRCSQRRW